MSILKISFESTVKRAKLGVSSFAELKEAVSKLFPQLKGSDEFFIQYADEVGDIVTVSDDDDVAVMLGDPSITKSKIIISRNLISNSEINKMMVSIPIQNSEFKMEPVQTEKAPEIGVYPEIKGNSEKIIKVEDSVSGGAKEEGKKRLRELRQKVRSGATLTESEVEEVKKLKEEKVAKKAERKEKKDKLLKDPELKDLKKKIKNPAKFQPAEVEEAKKKVMEKLEADPTAFQGFRRVRAAALEIKSSVKGLTPEETIELKTLQEVNTRKLAKKEAKRASKSRSASNGKERKCRAGLKAERKRSNSAKKADKYPRMVTLLRNLLTQNKELPEKAKARIAEILSTDPEAFKSTPRLRVLALKTKKAAGGLTPDQEEELTKNQAILESTPIGKPVGRDGSRSKARAQSPRRILKSRSKSAKKADKYPRMVTLLRNLLTQNKELPEKAKARITEILSTDPEAFKEKPRLRVLALRIKKASKGLSPEHEEELTKNQGILERKGEKMCAGSRSVSKGSLGRSNSQSRIQMLKRELKKEKILRKAKKQQVRNARMAAQVDRRVQTLIPGLANAIQFSIASGQPVNTSIHTGFQCDGCKMKPIVGVRHACRPCNFDLCSNCASKINHEHPLEKVDAPMRPVRQIGGQSVKPGMLRRGRQAVAKRAQASASPRKESQPRMGSTEKLVKKVVTIEEPKKEEARPDCPEWLKPKRDKIVSIFGSNVAKTEDYILTLKFKPLEEIIDLILSNKEELDKIM